MMFLQWMVVFSACMASYSYPTKEDVDITSDQLTMEDRNGEQAILKNLDQRCLEGDCIHHNVQQHKSGMSTKQRVAVNKKEWKWPSNEIPIEIPSDLFSEAESESEKIHKAMESIQKKTCVKFRDRRADDIHYITFTKNRTRCRTSFIGMNPEGATVVNLGDVTFFDIIFLGRMPTHELLHAIGLHHEHQRPDRDEYVTIHREKITIPMDDARFEENFGVLREPDWSTYGLPYDFMSIMHYSKDASGTDVIVPRPPYAKYATKMGDFFGEMTKNDAIKVNRMLGCPDHKKTPGGRCLFFKC